MAKKKAAGGDGENNDGEGTVEEAPTFGTIEPIEIQEEMERSFLDYAMSVIVSRALPDARDGLKPVHRRILWGMYDLRALPDRPTMKCARVTGEVMGKYHPHGDSAIYDALVRMGQSFSLRHPLVHPKGNFGSLDEPPAAARYTECRLAAMAMDMLADIDENTVDFSDNYSGEFQEPTVLPSRFPNLLVNGSQGIAVGMATNIPPHNLGEVIDAVNHLLQNPEATSKQLMEFVKGPDFPTGALIMGRQGIIDAYETGRGSIKLRGKAEIEEGTRSDYIIITELPYQVSPNQFMMKVKELVDNRELDGIAELNDESAKGQMRLVLRLKRDAPALVILNNLYKRTPLQTNFAVNTVALVDGIPRTLNLRDALVAYVDHQIEVITRRSQYRLDEAERRAHIVEGLLKALDLIDEIIAAIRASADKSAAPKRLWRNHSSFPLNKRNIFWTCSYRVSLVWAVPNSKKKWPNCGKPFPNYKPFLEMTVRSEPSLLRNSPKYAKSTPNHAEAKSPLKLAIWISKISSMMKISWSRCRPRVTSRPSLQMRSVYKVAAVVESRALG